MSYPKQRFESCQLFFLQSRGKEFDNVVVNTPVGFVADVFVDFKGGFQACIFINFFGDGHSLNRGLTEQRKNQFFIFFGVAVPINH
jgi:hypothetical protein